MRADLASLFRRGQRRWTVLAILSLGLVVRVPGIFWGTNFPLDGFSMHHPDEYTHWALVRHFLAPADTTVRAQHYPIGNAAPVAVLLLASRVATRTTAQRLPSRETIILTGRTVAALYGAMTVLVVLLLSQRFLARWSSVVAAGVATALGGLLVSQSHFFLADVPALFWCTLGLYLLRLDLDDESGKDVEYLQWCAFAFGVAFGTKLVVLGLPSLAIATLRPGPRIRRIAGAAVFFTAGFAIITVFTFTPSELRQALVQGVNVGSSLVLDRGNQALIYLLQFPSVFGLPVAAFAVIGGAAYARHSKLFRPSPFRFTAFLTVWLPLALALYFILRRLDPFPRHLLTLTPWAVIFAGAGFTWTQDRVRQLGLPAFVLPVVATAWLALLVFDGERHFVTEPRNQAAQWMLGHVPRGTETFWQYHPFRSYHHVNYSNGGTPQVIVMEMLFANDYLSGQGWRNSMPTDFHQVFGGQNQERMLRVQSLFTGGSGYHEVARFGEGYFMPELTVPLRLVGDRSRSYLTEVVIFERQ